MKKYRHLNQFDRDRIEALLGRGVKQREIADILEVHKTTISREIAKRKRNNGFYSASTAEHKARIKRGNSKYQGMKIEMNQELKRFIVREFKQGQSPDGIAGRMKEENRTPRVSSDAMYRWLRSPFGQQYCKYLCSKSANKKTRGIKSEKHIIQNMASIHGIPLDPGCIAEGDTFLSPRKTSKTSGLLVGWRETKLLKGDLVKSLRPVHTTKVLRKIGFQYVIDALILDQGGENRGHEQFGIKTYFCDPASPRQKPFIESSIGLLRRWFWPKGTNLRKVSKEEFQAKIEIINNKYRKSLHYRSANEMAREFGILKVNY